MIRLMLFKMSSMEGSCAGFIACPIQFAEGEFLQCEGDFNDKAAILKGLDGE
jgi:hypothetical protein